MVVKLDWDLTGSSRFFLYLVCSPFHEVYYHPKKNALWVIDQPTPMAQSTISYNKTCFHCHLFPFPIRATRPLVSNRLICYQPRTHIPKDLRFDHSIRSHRSANLGITKSQIVKFPWVLPLTLVIMTTASHRDERSKKKSDFPETLRKKMKVTPLSKNSDPILP